MSHFEIKNNVLLSLRPEAKDFIGRRLMTRRIFAGEVIYEEGAPLTHAVFPHEGIISYLAPMEDGRSVEKSSVGLDGVVGFTLIMGGSGAISRSVVLVPGYASWLARSDMDEALTEYECLRQAMLRYSIHLITRLMETVTCNALHTAEQRVARWMMQAHDNVSGDRFSITQQAIADALGLRRATVSEVCSRLQAEGLIDYSRGEIRVPEKEMLVGRACECYGRMLWRG